MHNWNITLSDFVLLRNIRVMKLYPLSFHLLTKTCHAANFAEKFFFILFESFLTLPYEEKMKDKKSRESLKRSNER